MGFQVRRLGVQAKKNCGCGCGGGCAGKANPRPRGRNSGSLSYERARQVQEIVTSWVWGKPGVLDVRLVRLDQTDFGVAVYTQVPVNVPSVVSGVSVLVLPC
jgi:hypothetical protein